MGKPTVFFSHSSQDSKVITRLKKAFAEKTGGTIEIFLSSDGQSIPLGRNWVHKVQEGLEEAELMIVFLTPNSLTSRWIYFEAGYSYSKKIQVVPVGCLGVDLAQVGAPLSLLQGFNIASADTLNNLIALVNDQFQHEHKPSFTNADYEEILGSYQESTGNPLEPVHHLLKDIKFSFNKRDDGLKTDPSGLLPEITQFLNDKKVECQSGGSVVLIRGAKISTNSGIYPDRLDVLADPITFHATLPILTKIITLIHSEVPHKLSFKFDLIPGMEVIRETHKITARLYDDPITFRSSDKLAFKGLLFNTGYYESPFKTSFERLNPYVKITSKVDLQIRDVAELIELLIERGVIFSEEIVGSPMSLNFSKQL